MGKANNTFTVIAIIEEFKSDGAAAGLKAIHSEAQKLVVEALIREVENAALRGGGKISSGVMAIWGIADLGYTMADLLTLEEKLLSEPQGLMQQAETAMRDNLSDAVRAKKVWNTMDCFCYGELD